MTPDLDNTTVDSASPTKNDEKTDTDTNKNTVSGENETESKFTTREKVHHIIYLAWVKAPFSPIETISIIGTYILILAASTYFGNPYNTLGIITLTSGGGLLISYIHEKGVINPTNILQKISYIGIICLTFGIGIRYTLMGLIFNYPL